MVRDLENCACEIIDKEVVWRMYNSTFIADRNIYFRFDYCGTKCYKQVYEKRLEVSS